MSEQHYRVIADRDKGDDPRLSDIEPGGRVMFGMVGGYGSPMVTRIERPVPTTDSRSQMERDSDALDELWRTPVPVEHPSLPTREQVYQAAQDAAIYPLNHRERTILDAVLALLQKGADR